MTRDDIIRMAKEAGHPFLTEVSVEEFVGMVPPWLERFAALVAAAEREKFIAWMRSKSYSTGHGDTIDDLLKELEWQVAERERKACAKICIEQGRPNTDSVNSEFNQLASYEFGKKVGATECAAAIRARGEQ